MTDQNDLKKIKEIVEEFFLKTTFDVVKITVKNGLNSNENTDPMNYSIDANDGNKEEKKEDKEAVAVNIDLLEPQVLIGEKGQTLFEIQRLLKMILNKKLQKFFYLDFDINNYKNKKVEYLRKIAKDLAGEVAFSKEKRILSPMSGYERRVVHMELEKRDDVITESAGQEPERYIIIKPK